MKNLISLVTGGTSGVGKSVALALAAQGSQVIVAGRDLIKTNAVCEHIARVTKNKSVFMPYQCSPIPQGHFIWDMLGITSLPT